MNLLKDKKSFYFVILLFLLWLGFSSYWYVCNIKDFCKNEIVKNSEYEELDEYGELDEYEEFEDGHTVISKVETINVSTKNISCSPYLFEKSSIFKNIVYGKKNSIREVAKLEDFLNKFEGENLKVNGSYELVDVNAVKRYQNKKTNGNNSDGVVGPKTIKFVNTDFCTKIANSLNNGSFLGRINKI